MRDCPDSNCFAEYEAAKTHFSVLLQNLQSYVTQTYEHGQIELGVALFGHDKSSYAAILKSPLAACRPE